MQDLYRFKRRTNEDWQCIQVKHTGEISSINPLKVDQDVPIEPGHYPVLTEKDRNTYIYCGVPFYLKPGHVRDNKRHFQVIDGNEDIGHLEPFHFSLMRQRLYKYYCRGVLWDLRTGKKLWTENYLPGEVNIEKTINQHCEGKPNTNFEFIFTWVDASNNSLPESTIIQPGSRDKYIGNVRFFSTKGQSWQWWKREWLHNDYTIPELSIVVDQLKRM